MTSSLDGPSDRRLADRRLIVGGHFRVIHCCVLIARKGFLPKTMFHLSEAKHRLR